MKRHTAAVSDISPAFNLLGVAGCMKENTEPQLSTQHTGASPRASNAQSLCTSSQLPHLHLYYGAQNPLCASHPYAALGTAATNYQPMPQPPYSSTSGIRNIYHQHTAIAPTASE